jgi:hypothetical protein
MWEREKTLPNVIQEAWLHTSRGGNLGQIVLSLKNVIGKLQRWSRDKFGSVNKELGTLRKKLEDECIKGDLADQKFLRHLTERMDELLCREEMMWLQRSRVSWLQEGDRNIIFFHRKAVWRARKNKIKNLKRTDGSHCTDQGEMGELTTSFFIDLYSSYQNSNPHILRNLIERKISEEMNDSMCKDFTNDEISDALFQIGPLKAPGPDGFPARFFPKELGCIRGG